MIPAMDASHTHSSHTNAADEPRREAGGSEVIFLNPSESESFFCALNAEPVPPTPRMTKALGLYRKTVVER